MGNNQAIIQNCSICKYFGKQYSFSTSKTFMEIFCAVCFAHAVSIYFASKAFLEVEVVMLSFTMQIIMAISFYK